MLEIITFCWSGTIGFEAVESLHGQWLKLKRPDVKMYSSLSFMNLDYYENMPAVLLHTTERKLILNFV